MKQIEEYWMKESRYTLSVDGTNYVREECEMNGGFHTIKWRYKDDEEALHYYASGVGWSDKNGNCRINQSAPYLENEFKIIK